MINAGDNVIRSSIKRSISSKLFENLVRFTGWSKQIVASAIIVSILIFVIINFYIFSSIVSWTSFFYVFIILSLLTDGLFILVQLFRRGVNHEKISCDPSKLSMVIACYNGADVIGETIRQAKKHVPAQQIIVVSDASTDNTADVARKLGVTVIENESNLSKVFSINKAMWKVTTPYVLLLDDDVLIGDAVIPTSLLDDGYTAVAFNVMPVEEDSLVNKLQMFEYRNSMQIGKNLRGNVGAIGNISGAIGLYRTKDLRKQVNYHSGQFAGEDEQRTILAHMYGEGKGITYTHETVTTLVPPTFRSLYRQRAYSWSLAVPELFTLYWRVIFSPRYHYLLKAEKAYYLYIYLTDPLRMLFLWALILQPQHMLATYVFYLVFNFMVWARMGAKDSLFVVLVYPIYKLWLIICRFVGNFYWLKVKALYIRDRLHARVVQRRLIPEYGLVIAVFVGLWTLSAQHFVGDMQLYSQIRANRLDDPVKAFSYEDTQTVSNISARELNMRFKAEPPQDGTFVSVKLEKGDTGRAIAYKAVNEVTATRPDMNVPYEIRSKVDSKVLKALQSEGAYLTPSSMMLIEVNMLEDAIRTSIKEHTEAKS